MPNLGKRVVRAIGRRVTAALGIDVFRSASPFHVALDYPISRRSRYGYKVPPPPQIARLIEAARGRHIKFLRSLPSLAPLSKDIGYEADEVGPTEPFWNNRWLPPGDCAAMLHFISTVKPRRYVEIGSGNSTKWARYAIRSAGLGTQIISIDPEPRAEIDALCDEVIRAKLEDVDLRVMDRLEPGDILFFDGSHRTFTDSDVTIFFLEVLPRLPAGVVIQIHDIFWPLDYPTSWSDRDYSEQYMVGLLMILASDKIEILLANAYIEQDPDLLSLASEMIPADSNRLIGLQPGGIWATGLWFEIKTALSRAA
jgi:hypothetical protein